MSPWVAEERIANLHFESLHSTYRGSSNDVPQTHDIYVSNINSIPGKRVKDYVGLVQGSTVRTRNVLRTILGGLKGIVGGEMKTFTKLLQDTRDRALERMLLEAKERGANAVINIRFATSEVFDGAAEVFAYGTAVVVE